MDPEKLSQLTIERKASAGPTPKRRSRRLPLAVLGAIVIAAVLWHLQRAGFLTPSTSVRLAPVSLIHPSQTLTELNASGYVVAESKAAVASKGTGRLVDLKVREGSRVRRGDILGRLENEDLEAEAQQARAQLLAARARLDEAEAERRTAERNWERFRALWDKQLVALADFDSATDRHRKAQAAVHAARAAIKAQEAAVERAAVLLDYTLIRAPFDGVVLTKNADVGEVVAPFASATNAKAAVVTMADLASLLVEADVAEAFLPRVWIGQPCEIQMDALPRERFGGSVDTIVPTADRTKGTVLVKVRFDQLEARILPEMSARVAFLARPLTAPETRPVLAVHQDAVTTRNGETGVFLREAGRVLWTPLEPLVRMGDYVVLGEPFQAGDQAVLKPPPRLKPGQRINVSE